MKKILLLSALILLTKISFCQGKGVTPKFSGDVPIFQNSSLNERNVRLTVAFNGWIYAAYSIKDSTNSSGIKIMYSKDNGNSWNAFDSYLFNDITYPSFDIVVAGTDTNNLSLFLAGARKNSDTDYLLYIDKYNATTAQYIGNQYLTNKNNSIIDIAIASDYQFPSTVSAPYSIGVIYSKRGSIDSINYVLSMDGGTTFNYTNSIAQTNLFYRKVSLAYGKSLSASNGRFFAAWEQLINGDESSTGHIFTSRNESYLNDAWIPQINIDSIAPACIGLCKNPTIAAQFNNVDNDSASVSAIVAFERDYEGAGNDHDILGFYNMTASHTNNWTRLDINNSTSNCIQPHISYDPAGNHFLAVYFDSTAKKLPYVINGMNFNLSDPDTWLTITEQYNDDTNMVAPRPRVQINPVLNQTAHVWIAEDQNNFGIAMFDAEYSHTGINEESKSIFSDEAIYPNPVSETATISFNTEGSATATLLICDITGKIIVNKEITNINAGKGVEKIDVRDWNNGVYSCSISSDKERITSRFVVAH